MLRVGGRGREAAIAKVAADTASRTAHITVDARLQVAVSQILRRAATKGKAAAAVVLDVNTGEVLARAQWPDFNPGDPSLRERLEDPQFATRDVKFTGYYGAWPDKTGIRGIYQGGSAAKLFTSVAAARAGVLGSASACPAKAGPVFACVNRDAKGPYFTRPGWYAPVHDIAMDNPHGHIEFIKGLAVSCNVYFGQLGLQLGPETFEKLVADGLDMGWGRGWYKAGKPGSRDLALTAFGQHAAMMSVWQAARLAGTIGGGGVYRKCPPSMELGAPCEQKQLLPDAHLLTPVLAGMEQVMMIGTGRGLVKTPGVPPALRVYGTTGTAAYIRGLSGATQRLGAAAGVPPPPSPAPPAAAPASRPGTPPPAATARPPPASPRPPASSASPSAASPPPATPSPTPTPTASPS